MHPTMHCESKWAEKGVFHGEIWERWWWWQGLFSKENARTNVTVLIHVRRDVWVRRPGLGSWLAPAAPCGHKHVHLHWFQLGQIVDARLRLRTVLDDGRMQSGLCSRR